MAADNSPGKKPGLAIMIGVGKADPGKGSQPNDSSAPPSKGTPPPFMAKKAGNSKSSKPSGKPSPKDKTDAIARRLSALNNKGPSGPSPTNNDAGNASGGLPGF